MNVILKMMYMGKNFLWDAFSWFSINEAEKNKESSLTAVILSTPSVLCLYFLAFRNTPCLPFESFRRARQVAPNVGLDESSLQPLPVETTKVRKSVYTCILRGRKEYCREYKPWYKIIASVVCAYVTDNVKGLGNTGY